jgi:hypothetical protein
MFVDWHAVNAMFCGVMWLLALVLALMIIGHHLSGAPAPPLHHALLHAVAR